MAVKTGTTESESRGQSTSKSSSTSRSTTQKVLNDALRDTILAGLLGGMTDEEIEIYAQNLLRPQMEAQKEASRQSYEATKLGKEQEIEDIAAALEKSVGEQRGAYQRSAADVQTAALARGMGRSSYLLDTLAGRGDMLAQAIERLTQDSERERAQAQAQITQAAQQNAATQGRLEADYASSLAAKVQELRNAQQQQYNQNYMAAVNASIGTAQSGTQSTLGSSTTETTGKSETYAPGGGAAATTSTSTKKSSSAGSTKKSSSNEVDVISGAAMSVKNRRT